VADPQVPESINAYLREAGLVARGPKVVPLTGDASDRRYFRVFLPDAGAATAPEAKSIVLALHAGPIDFDTLPFANVAELLRRLALPVPAILGHSNALGILALEDLGDVTLQAHLGAAPPAVHAALYREAVSLIEQLQRGGDRERSSPGAAARYLPYQIAFDVEKLTWELNFFVRHFLEAYRGVALSAAERDALAGEWTSIATELAAEPRVLCHRDYHSRNLMLHDGGLHIIDFQDARMGPDTYDLASLLRDSYVDFTDVELDELIAYFLALKGDRDAALFRRRFDLMALQRNLKALGTFGYQTTTRGNPVYIQYMPRTLRYARTTLARHDRFAPLSDVLAAHLDELR
jgi:aminoglycoside/choline kinase family phosphotransferase